MTIFLFVLFVMSMVCNAALLLLWRADHERAWAMATRFEAKSDRWRDAALGDKP